MNKYNTNFSVEQCDIFNKALLNGNLTIVNDYIFRGFEINEPCGKEGKLYPMQIISIKGHPSTAEHLYTIGAKLNYLTSDGGSLVHIASSFNNIQMIDCLSKKGLNLNQQNHDGQTPLMVAAIKGNTGAAAALLKYHVATEMKDTFGQTALHTTALSCNNDIANLLKTYNADTHAKSNAGLSLLHIAARDNCPSIVKFALDNGVAIDTKDNANHSAIIYAMHFNKNFFKYYSDQETIKQTYANNLNEDFFIHHADQEASKQEYINEQFYKTLDILIENKANINEKFLKSSLLHAAIIQSDLKLAKYLIKSGINLEAFDLHHYTPLQVACDKGDIEAIKLLLEAGADPNNNPVNTSPPLLIAISNKHNEVVKYLLDNSADPNSLVVINNNIYSPLIMAINSENLEAIDLLFTHGANPNYNLNISHKESSIYRSLFMEQETPFTHALISTNASIIRKFLDNGADLEQLKIASPLYKAIELKNIDTFKLLIEAGVDIYETDYKGNLLHHCAYAGFSEGIKYLTNTGLKYHLNNPKFIEMENYYQQTPLILAITKESIEAVSTLLKVDANPNMKNISYKNLMLHAFKIGKIEIIKLIEEAGGDIKARTENGENLLHIAAQTNNIALLDYALEKEFELKEENNFCPIYMDHTNYTTPENHSNNIISYIETVNSLQQTPLLLATKAGSKEVIARLLDLGANPHAQDMFYETPMLASFKRGEIEITKLLEEAGGDIKARNVKGDTLLHIAAEGGNNELLDYAIDKGFDLNEVNNFGHTPLHYATSMYNVEMTKRILEEKIDINIKDYDGDDALYTTIESFNFKTKEDNLFRMMIDEYENHCEIVNSLLENGADALQIKAETGNNLLHLTAVKSTGCVLSELYDRGVDLRAKNKDGHTPYELAEQANNKEVLARIEFIEDRKVDIIRAYLEHLANNKEEIEVIGNESSSYATE